MRVRYVTLALLVVLVASLTASAAFELRTWSTPAAAPADGDSHSGSPSFEMVSRLGGPFVGSASSGSFTLWGCSVTPVEGAFIATETEALCVTLRWTVESLAGIDGFHIYRAWEEDGPYERVNETLLEAASPGFYEATTVWPGSSFWYELRAVMPGGAEDIVAEPLMLVTGGTLETKLYAASPNPFRETATIQYDVTTASRGVSLVVYDISGRVVKRLGDLATRPGRHAAVWDGSNDRGQRVASGVYFYSLEAAGVREMRRLVYLR